MSEIESKEVKTSGAKTKGRGRPAKKVDRVKQEDNERIDVKEVDEKLQLQQKQDQQQFQEKEQEQEKECQQQQEQEQEQIQKQTQQEQEPKRRLRIQLDPNLLIPVRSVTYGGLTYISTKTRMTYRWNDYGSIVDVEFGELRNMLASNPRFLHEPYMIVEDDEAAEALRLTEIYSKMAMIDNLQDLFKKPFNEIEKILRNLPQGMKDTVASKARQMIENGKLDSLRIIKLIEKELNVDLQIFIKD